ncbi:37_t:CDS:2 [Cetraspora pellucida]|uniref:37_t:CDS:1 n=1 Tax=Cetraspora pellucida TaxID=1433469 RepID=A0A9N9G2B8_9GLOM|nr:37_t:CDS:2 [Cetraspora pellucida]
MSSDAKRSGPSGPPPLPSRKSKGKDENYENIRFSANSRNANEKYQMMQSAYDKSIKENEELERETKELHSQVSDLETKNGILQRSCQDLNSRFETERGRWQQRIHDSDIEFQNLKKQHVDLEKETRKYQDALGKMKSFHFGDDHTSNTVELAKTISDIVVLLEEFTSVKGKDVSINEEAANELLFHYKCVMRIKEGKGKPVLSAALQRLILEELFRFISEYLFQPKLQSSDYQSEHSQPQQPPLQPQQLQQLQQPQQPPPQQSQIQQQEVDQQDPVTKARTAIAVGRSHSLQQRPPLPSVPGDSVEEQIIEVDDNNLEAEIATCMKVLCDLVNQLSESRKGTDDITKVTPINIRQQVYAVLGTRGFCTDKHPFVDQLTDTILKTVGKYRQFKTKEKQTESHERAAKIAKEVVLLYFRLLAQEPVPEFTEFFEAGTPLQVNIMEGTWDDYEINDLEVEICSFPLVSVKGKDDSRKVLNKGVVLTRRKNINPSNMD